MIEQVEREFGRLDVLVNNAGWSTRVPHRNLDHSPTRFGTRRSTSIFTASSTAFARRSLSPQATRRIDRQHCIRRWLYRCRQFDGLRSRQSRRDHHDEIARPRTRPEIRVNAISQVSSARISPVVLIPIRYSTSRSASRRSIDLLPSPNALKLLFSLRPPRLRSPARTCWLTAACTRWVPIARCGSIENCRPSLRAFRRLQYPIR